MDFPRTDYFYSTHQRLLGSWLILLLGLFAVRVIIQLQLVVNPIANLPDFAEWHSAAVPYPVLFGCQVIILLTGWVYVWRLFTSQVSKWPNLGATVFILGWVYWSAMIIRLILGFSLFQDIQWFAREIPTLFHLLLANMLMLVGNFHRKREPD